MPKMHFKLLCLVLLPCKQKTIAQHKNTNTTEITDSIIVAIKVSVRSYAFVQDKARNTNTIETHRHPPSPITDNASDDC